jgi:threonine/homoserine/homoserine lactone efflux protein
MNYASIFLVSFTIALSGALMPGPLLATVIYESTKQGAKTGPLMILGHGLLEMLMLVLLIFGFTRYIHNPLALKIIAILGAFLLCFFGIKMLLSVPKLSLDFGPDYKYSSNLVLTGITMSLANPYWTIWWLTIGLGLFLGAERLGYVAVGVFFVGHILADLSWYSVVSLTISKGKKFISLKVYKGIIFVCAVILIVFGIYFGVNYSRLMG